MNFQTVSFVLLKLSFQILQAKPHKTSLKKEDTRFIEAWSI